MAFMVMTGSAACSASSSLVTYAAPEGAELNDDFTVQVRQGDGEWRNVPSYLVCVDEDGETVQIKCLPRGGFVGRLD